MQEINGSDSTGKSETFCVLHSFRYSRIFDKEDYYEKKLRQTVQIGTLTQAGHTPLLVHSVSANVVRNSCVSQSRKIRVPKMIENAVKC